MTFTYAAASDLRRAWPNFELDLPLEPLPGGAANPFYVERPENPVAPAPSAPADGLPVWSPPASEDTLAGNLTQAAETVEDKLASLADNVAALGASLGMASSTLEVASAPASEAAVAPTPEPAPAPVIPAAAIPNTVEEAGDFAQLQAIKGIGVMYALTLTKSGIASVSDLANASVDQIDAMIRAPRWRKPDYADWIRQAREGIGVNEPV